MNTQRLVHSGEVLLIFVTGEVLLMDHAACCAARGFAASIACRRRRSCFYY